MRKYELVLVFRSSLSEAKRKKLFDTIKTWLKPVKGEDKDLKVVKEEEWGQKALSYPIKREGSGYYVYLELETALIPSDFEKKLLSQDDLLRHLLIRTK